MDNAIIIENLLSNKKDKKDKNLRLFDCLDTVELGKTLCGYLNGTGGDIILGISTNKLVTGIEKEWKDIIEEEVVKKLSPSAPITSNIILYRENDVLLISAWPGAKKPYSFLGKIYIVESGIAKTASGKDLKSLNTNRKESEFHWERQVILGADIEELDHQEIKKTISEYLKFNPSINKLNLEDFLMKLGLIQGGSLTNGAIILFGSNPVRYLPQCKVRATIYDSSKAGKVILFDRIYDNNLFRNIQSIWDFFDTHLKREESISGLLRKKEQLPIVALREGLLNAIIHRDYSKVSSTVNIEVFPEKLVISNTGRLPDTMSVKDLKKDHGSILRNPDIAYICYIKRYIEMLGTGTLRMIAECEENKYPVPVWKTKGSKLELTLKGISHRIKSDGVNDGVSDGVNRAVKDGVSDGVIDGISDGVIKEIIAIINLLENKEGINTDDIVEKIGGKSKPTIERYLKIARDLNIIEFRGASKTGGYYLTEKMMRELR